MSETVEASLTLPEEDVYAEFCKREWCDGLPFVPPTAERVRAMLAGAKTKPAESLGVMPPLWRECAVEKLAVNAVMAGCRPEYFPVVLAVVEAACDPVFNLHGQSGTTNAASPLIIINGPIRKQIEVNSGRGCLGPGSRANMTIGRALRLVLMNVGGGLPGSGRRCRSTAGPTYHSGAPVQGPVEPGAFTRTIRSSSTSTRVCSGRPGWLRTAIAPSARNASALSVRSQVNSGSVLPKCPNAAVFL